MPYFNVPVKCEYATVVQVEAANADEALSAAEAIADIRTMNFVHGSVEAYSPEPCDEHGQPLPHKPFLDVLRERVQRESDAGSQSG